MVTWAGAIVESRRAGDLAAAGSKHGIEMVDTGTGPGWLLVDVGVNAAHLRPPKFAERLSRDIQGTVIGFFLQSTASCEDIEHWHDGTLLRRLVYSADEGGWITQFGSVQPWEAAYFFPTGEGTEDGEEWPSNLGDEIADDEIARYRQAKAAQDASGVMELLSAGSPSSIRRLCAHFGIDIERPAARFTPPANLKPWLVLAAIVLLLAGAMLLGALFPAPIPK